MLEHSLSEEEHSQIVQTIEMFEAITQTHPDDSQSLEILKEAYQKIGKPADSLRICRRLAEAYFNAGSFTLAMQECEAILAKEPSAPDGLSGPRLFTAKLSTRPRSNALSPARMPRFRRW